MTSERESTSPPKAVEALKTYYNTHPAPDDPKTWFDNQYPGAARPALVALREAAGAVLDMVKRSDEPVSRESVLGTLRAQWGLPGWSFPDGSAIWMDLETPELLWTRGARDSTRLVTPEEVLESSTLVDVLATHGSDKDIRMAALGPYRDHLHLLLESSDARVRERAIAVLGEVKQEPDTGK